MKKILIFISIVVLVFGESKSQTSTAQVKKLIKAGNIQEIDRIISGGLNINTTFKRKSTLLHFAVEFGQYHIVNYLIKKGADLDLQDRDKNTPLMLSTELSHQNDSISELLINSGANTNIGGLHGSTPLRNTIGIFRVGQNMKIFKLLVEKGADVNYCCKECCSHSIFLYCCSWGTSEMLDILIKKNVDVNSENCNGLNGLMCAIKTKNKMAIKFLLATNINFNHLDKKGRTIMDYAIKSEDAEIIKMIESVKQP